MTKDNLAQLVQLAHAHPGPIASAVLAAAHGDMVHPGLLQSGLQDAGFSGALEQRGARYELRITSSAGELLAWSNAPDPGEAVLHAVLGFLRECDSGQRDSSAAGE